MEEEIPAPIIITHMEEEDDTSSILRLLYALRTSATEPNEFIFQIPTEDVEAERVTFRSV